MATLASRWQRWWSARHPRADTHHLTQRNLYIVPTRPGLFFCATLAVLLLASINEQLSLGFALSFLLAGAGLASMLATHANLRGLDLDLRPPEAVEAGSEAPLLLRLHNPGAARYGIALTADRREWRHFLKSDPLRGSAWADVPAQGHAQVQVALPALPRGLHALPTLRLETRFPLGLFRAWSYWRPASALLVYPKAEALPPPLPAGAGEGQRLPASASGARGGDEVQGLRPYQRGDRPRDIHWKKALPQGDAPPQWWVRERQPPQGQALWLRWEDTAGMDEEARLARLCAWVRLADGQGLRYGLQLPRLHLDLDCGDGHLQACLRALALHGLSETPQEPQP
ncbi:DUF58 domain-containing protein [Roseateles sp. DB2]|uniref:DUF58 domain-containing protein n=1 Tax=Roseateles sp. DB2 TaxID=3453717 RepID=UPI003EEEC797